MITQERLKQVLLYDEGQFVRLIKTANCSKVGEIVGSITGKGYHHISIDFKRYYTHRLVWLYFHGYMPSIIDHINGDTLDNRIENLREVDKLGNAQNERKARVHNRSKLLGVSWHKSSGKYQAKISVNRKRIYLGTYETPQEAHEAYLKAKRRLHSTNTL